MFCDLLDGGDRFKTGLMNNGSSSVKQQKPKESIDDIRFREIRSRFDNTLKKSSLFDSNSEIPFAKNALNVEIPKFFLKSRQSQLLDGSAENQTNKGGGFWDQGESKHLNKTSSQPLLKSNPRLNIPVNSRVGQEEVDLLNNDPSIYSINTKNQISGRRILRVHQNKNK